MLMSEQPKKDNKFIVGIVCLVLSMGFLLFALYILPYLLWNLGYDVPDFLINFLAYLQEDQSYSVFNSKLITWLLFFIPGAITGYISYYISNRLDQEKPSEPE